MVDQDQLDRMLNDIEEQQPGCADGCARFMLACLSQIRHRLPLLAGQALELAQRYAAGTVPAADVIQMRVECWRQLRNHEMETDDPSVCALRAVICVLHTPEEGQQDDIVDLLSFFLVLVNRIEPRYAQQEHLLRECFAKDAGPHGSTNSTDQ